MLITASGQSSTTAMVIGALVIAVLVHYYCTSFRRFSSFSSTFGFSAFCTKTAHLALLVPTLEKAKTNGLLVVLAPQY